MAPLPLARGVGLREDWAKQNLSSLVCSNGLGFWQSAVDVPSALDSSAVSSAQTSCAVSAEWGRQCTLQTLAARLSAHKQPELRTSAVKALSKLVRPGDSVAIGALASALSDGASEVCLAASEALGLLAEQGDPTALSALESAHGAHDDPLVRSTTVSELARLRPRGDPATLADLTRCADDDSPVVRERAARVLPSIAEPGEAGAVALAVRLLGDPSAHVQHAAADALELLAGPGLRNAEAVVGPLARAAECRDALSREAALEVLARVAPTGHSGAVGAALVCLQHREPRVRLAAVCCLSQLARAGSLAASGALAECLHEDDSPSVRLTALEVLLRLAGEADAVALAAVVESCEHPDEMVSGTARGNLGQALDSIAHAAGAAASSELGGALTAAAAAGAEAAVAQLRRADWRSRGAAARLLALVLPLRGEALALKAASASLKDRGCDWRDRVTVEAAAKVLLKHLPSGTVSGQTAALPAIMVLAELLQDADQRVRRSAATAMGALAKRARMALGGARPRCARGDARGPSP